MDLISMVPDVTSTLAAAACLVVLASLATSALALRRSRALARSSAALMAELAVFRDAAVSLGQHLDRRTGGASAVERGATSAPANVSQLQPQGAHAHTLQEVAAPSFVNHPHPLHATPPVSTGMGMSMVNAPVIAPDAQRALELARQGASIDDLVAACDVSRTEAGLMLAMSRRGRRVLAG